MKLSLQVLVPGASTGKSIPITRSPFLVGRDPKCHLRPSSALVSNRHCALQVRDGKVFVTDLGSTNGTMVNEQPVPAKKERELQNDDRLQIGPLLFAVRIERGVAVDQPTPMPPTKSAMPLGNPDDDSVAEVLLSMQDDASGPTTTTGPVDSTGVPTGGTEVLKTQDLGQAPAEPTSANGTPTSESKNIKPEEKKKDEKKPAGNTSAVAEELLKKYLRRPRKV